MSRHLSVLKDADLISAERQGNQILYRINTSVVEDTAGALLSFIGIGQEDADKDDLDYEEAAE